MPGRTPSVFQASAGPAGSSVGRWIARGLVLAASTGCASRAAQAASATVPSSTVSAAAAAPAPSPVDSSALEILNAAVGAPETDPPAGESATADATASRSSRAWLGVELGRTPDRRAGAVVRSVIRGSPADRAGIREGDLLTSVDGHAVQGPGDVIRIVAGHAPGDDVPVVFTRGDAPRVLRIALAAFPDQDDMLRMQFAGQHAPDLLGLSPVQGSVASNIGSLRGKVLLIEFWASWCVPCRVLAPKIEDLYQRLGPQGVAVLGVTTDPVSEASRAVSEFGIKYPVASDESGDTTRAYRAMALPTVFVIDRQGVVRDVMVGYSTHRIDEIGKLIEKLLGP